MIELSSDLDFFPVRLNLALRFRRLVHRDVVVIRGEFGWGEYGPFADYDQRLRLLCAQSAVEAATQPEPALLRSEIPVNLSVPAVSPNQATRMVANFGGDTVKVKIAEPGESFASDLARVEAVRIALGEEGKIRVDINGAWTLREAEQNLSKLAVLRLQYAEQPCREFADLVRLRQVIDVPIAVDESVRLHPNPEQVIGAGAADYLVLKPQPLGGVSSTLALASLSPVPVVISSALESSVGMWVGLATAAALPNPPLAAGLGTVCLFEQDLTVDPLLECEGKIEVRRPEPDPGRLALLKPPPDVSANLLAQLNQDLAQLALQNQPSKTGISS